ncbi:two-component system sensor histidine kinase NtrB [Salinarimonas ramus]|nr:PAS domain S-box protein [Salinarimonas ramus]
MDESTTGDGDGRPGIPAGTPPVLGSTSDARWASILNTAVDGIIVIDERARVMIFNRACERMFGYAAEEVVGRNVAMLMPPEHSGDHDAYVQRYMRTGHRKIIGIGREVRARHRDGTMFPIDLSVGEAQTPDGRQFVGILRDLTSRKDAERRLNDLQSDLIRLARVSALDEMGSALAHELNQPLTAIMLYLQAVGREFARAKEMGHTREADARADAILEKARREAHRAGSIIQRIRSLVEKRAPERKPVDLNAIVDDALELTVIGQDRNVALVRDYQAGLPPLRVDPVQIQQVVVNLVRNAYEAVKGRRGGRIVVSTSLDDRHLLVSVEDSGPGIPREVLTDLFKAFKTTGGGAGGGKSSGMGLGLAISRTIAQNHGGDLSVDPGGDGRGARFVVRLPLRAPEDERAGEDAAETSRGEQEWGRA